jgi:hypothetical protein
MSTLLKELQEYGVPEQRSCEIASQFIAAGARCVFAQLGEIAGRNEATPLDIARLSAMLIAEGNGGRFGNAILRKGRSE